MSSISCFLTKEKKKSDQSATWLLKIVDKARMNILLDGFPFFCSEGNSYLQWMKV